MNDSNSLLVNCVPLSVTKVLRKAMGSKHVVQMTMVTLKLEAVTSFTSSFFE